MENVEKIIYELRNKNIHMKDIEDELMFRMNNHDERLDERLINYNSEQLEDAYNFWCEY